MYCTINTLHVDDVDLPYTSPEQRNMENLAREPRRWGELLTAESVQTSKTTRKWITNHNATRSFQFTKRKEPARQLQEQVLMNWPDSGNIRHNILKITERFEKIREPTKDL